MRGERGWRQQQQAVVWWEFSDGFKISYHVNPQKTTV